jgi:hypothetical protein
MCIPISHAYLSSVSMSHAYIFVSHAYIFMSHAYIFMSHAYIFMSHAYILTVVGNGAIGYFTGLIAGVAAIYSLLSAPAAKYFGNNRPLMIIGGSAFIAETIAFFHCDHRYNGAIWTTAHTLCTMCTLHCTLYTTHTMHCTPY